MELRRATEKDIPEWAKKLGYDKYFMDLAAKFNSAPDKEKRVLKA